MATMQQLEEALRNADAAGETDDARLIAMEIQRMKPPTQVNPDLPPEFGGDDGSVNPFTEAAAISQAENQDLSAWDTFSGIVDAMQTTISGAVGGALGGTLGVAKGVAGSVMDGTYGTQEGVDQVAASRDGMADAITTPLTTPGGRQIMGEIGQGLSYLMDPSRLGPLEAAIPSGPLAPMRQAVISGGRAARNSLDAAGETLDATAQRGYEAASNMAEAVPGASAFTPLRADSVDIDPALMAQRAARESRLNESQQIVTDRWLGPEMAKVVRESSPGMRERFARQVAESRIVREGGPAARDASARNPIANEIHLRGVVLADVGQRYLSDLNDARAKMNAADQSGVLIATRSLEKDIIEMLGQYGVKVDGKTGALDGRDGAIPKSELSKLNEATQRFFQGTRRQGESDTSGGGAAGVSSFDNLHNLKRYLQRIGYTNSRNQGSGGDANEIIKQMSGKVNGYIREISPEYAAANDGLSDIITVFNDMKQSIKPKADISFTEDFTARDMKEIARQSRSLTNNTKSGIDLDETLRLMDDTILSEGGDLGPDVMDALNIIDDGAGNLSMGTDLRQMAVFAEQLNQLMGDGKVTSFHDLIKSASNGQGGHLANAGYNAIWGNYVGMTADLAKQAGKARGNNPKKVAKRHDALVQERRKFEDYNREAVLESIDKLLSD